MAPSVNPSRCCERCFKDPYLLEIIREEGRRGNCPWCGAKRVKTVPLSLLTEAFQGVLESYVQSDSGELLGHIFEDWESFGDVLSRDPERRQNLVVAILEEGLPGGAKDRLEYPDYCDDFSPKWGQESWGLADQWEEAILELLNRDRSSRWPEDLQLEFAIEDLGIKYIPDDKLFRARIYAGSEQGSRYGLADLTAPPPEKTPAGRANRVGQPVLYMANDLQTAIAEIRPWKHAAVAIATMQVQKELRVLDLTASAAITSPFGFSDLNWAVEARHLLARFAEELSRPVSLHDKVEEYRPSQLICDAVQKAGFQGIVYPSAVADGKNVVLFDSPAATPQSLSHVRVTSVSYSHKSMSEGEPIWWSPWVPL
jgi:RES domain-containing protein